MKQSIYRQATPTELAYGIAQNCVGCQRLIFAQYWFRHSQECIVLEAVVELAMSMKLADCLPLEGRD